MNKNITKDKLIKKVVKRLQKFYLKIHVVNVINILIDELIKDFIQDKSLKIYNFCEIKYKTYAPKKFIGLFSKKQEISDSKTRLILKVNSKLANILNKDIEEVKEEDLNE